MNPSLKPLPDCRLPSARQQKSVLQMCGVVAALFALLAASSMTYAEITATLAQRHQTAPMDPGQIRVEAVHKRISMMPSTQAPNVVSISAFQESQPLVLLDVDRDQTPEADAVCQALRFPSRPRELEGVPVFVGDRNGNVMRTC
jgi:hypothetical protein